MSYSPPDPPPILSSTIVSDLDEVSTDELRAIAEYADSLAEYKERERRVSDTEESTADAEPRPDNTPDDVPSNATITVKEIKGNRYYYWQWRDGEKIRSKYKGPVNSSE